MTEQLAFWQPAAPACPPAHAKVERVTPTVRELPDDERPASRLREYGPAALSRAELLAVLLGSPHQLEDARALLARYGDLGSIVRASAVELQQQPGLGPAAAARIKAALELGQRLAVERPDQKVQVHNPSDIAQLVTPTMGLLDHEELRVLLLDTKNRLVNITTVYTGSVNTAVIRVGEVFREAIRQNCPAIVVTHNHPSGDPTPSPEDVAVTRQIVDAGKLMDIDVLDHLVIARTRFVSMREQALGFA